jgi:heavy-metal resistance protein
MKRKLIPLIFIFSLALNLVGLVFLGAHAFQSTEPEPVASSQMSCARECSLHQTLGTDAASQAALKPLLEAFGQERCRICRQIDTARAELIEALAVSTPDMELIAVKQGKILEGQRQMQELIVKQILQEKTHLSPEQQEKLFGVFRTSCRCADGDDPQGACQRSCESK